MTGLIILAAGESSRMGKPKQLLPYKGKTLLRHAVDEALASECKTIVVVFGAYADNLQNEIKAEAVTIVNNPLWQEGMASSIRAGIETLQPDTDIHSAIIMLCDQPFVDAALINQLIHQKNNTQKSIIACAYNDTYGVPILFSRDYFPSLLTLTGKEGAKKILVNFEYDMALVPFKKGATDIDTPADYEDLL